MATDTSATIIQLHQPKPATAAERAKAYRARKRAEAGTGTKLPPSSVPVSSPEPAVTPVTLLTSVDLPAVTPVTPSRVTETVTPSRVTSRHGDRHAAIALQIAALALAGVGVTMNGWFARSLGSTDVAGWLFLGVGVAADLAALALPSSAAQRWQAGQRGTAVAGWLIWSMTFAFAVTAGIGFASVNISDVTQARASRVTPAVTAAQDALRDAMTARDRECVHGVGKFCRERETAVTDRRQALDAAMATVEHAADPQTEAATRIVTWLSMGTVKPSDGDFAMLRLILLALLPQVGGVLLMVGRVK